MKRIVAVTGATGFIGWHVARRFLESGWQVRALVRPESQRPVPDGVERVRTPLHQADIVAACSNVSHVIHLAGAVGHRTEAEFVRSNVEAAAAVAHAAQQLGVRLLHTSSLGATGPRPPNKPPGEDDSLQPINAYGESKKRSEEMVRNVNGLDWVIVRPTLVYGPRDRLFLPLFKSARRGLFPIPNDTAYNVVHVEDVARGIELAATDAVSGETFLLGHPEHVTVVTLLQRLASVLGRQFRPIRIPRLALKTAAQVGDLLEMAGWPVGLNRARYKEIVAEGFVCRVDKARERLGFVATKELMTGLAETARWYEANRWM